MHLPGETDAQDLGGVYTRLGHHLAEAADSCLPPQLGVLLGP